MVMVTAKHALEKQNKRNVMCYVCVVSHNTDYVKCDDMKKTMINHELDDAS